MGELHHVRGLQGQLRRQRSQPNQRAGADDAFCRVGVVDRPQHRLVTQQLTVKLLCLCSGARICLATCVIVCSRHMVNNDNDSTVQKNKTTAYRDGHVCLALRPRSRPPPCVAAGCPGPARHVRPADRAPPAPRAPGRRCCSRRRGGPTLRDRRARPGHCARCCCPARLWMQLLSHGLVLSISQWV